MQPVYLSLGLVGGPSHQNAVILEVIHHPLLTSIRGTIVRLHSRPYLHGFEEGECVGESNALPPSIRLANS